MRGAALVCLLAGACSFNQAGPDRVTDGGPVATADGAGALADGPENLPSADAAGPGADAAEPADATPATDAAAPAPIGSPCPTGGECGAGQFCLGEAEGWPAGGYCSALCLIDEDCGDDAFCTEDLGSGSLCIAACNEGDCDEPGQICSDTVAGVFPLGGRGCIPGDAGAADGDPCVSFADCAGGQFCLDNEFEAPGGECLTLGCTPGESDTCAAVGDGVCLALGGGVTACFNHCKADEDCREGEGYECAVGGNVCYYPHAQPGDACATNADCGGPPWKCLKGPDFPGGYCGADDCAPEDEGTCPSDALCYDDTPGSPPDAKQFCAALCEDDFDCRTTPGYRCLTAGDDLPDVCRLP